MQLKAVLIVMHDPLHFRGTANIYTIRPSTTMIYRVHLAGRPNDSKSTGVGLLLRLSGCLGIYYYSSFFKKCSGL